MILEVEKQQEVIASGQSGGASNPLASIENATHALSQARDLSDVQQVRDVAEAARHYAKAAKLGIEAQNHAAEIKIRAERRAGELLAELERGKGGDRRSEEFQNGQPVRFDSEYREAIEDAEVNERTARRWQQIAQLPEETFEEHIEEAKAEGAELTTSGLMRKVQEHKREEMRTNKHEPVSPPDDKSYRVLYADPPWSYGNSGVINESDSYGRAERHYPSMSIDELCEMGAQVKKATDDNAVLFMWVTSPLLEECFPVIKAWGFKYKTSFVWDKVKHNYGHYNSVRHEFLLICTRGSCTPDEKKLFDSVVEVERSNKHSEKPQEFREIIDTLYTHGDKIEFFAREKADGWDAWGNESAIQN